MTEGLTGRMDRRQVLSKLLKLSGTAAFMSSPIAGIIADTFSSGRVEQHSNPRTSPPLIAADAIDRQTGWGMGSKAFGTRNCQEIGVWPGSRSKASTHGSHD